MGLFKIDTVGKRQDGNRHIQLHIRCRDYRTSPQVNPVILFHEGARLCSTEMVKDIVEFELAGPSGLFSFDCCCYRYRH